MAETAEQILDRLKKAKLVFISTPYTKPDVGTNIHRAVKVFNQLLDEGKCVPMCMLWTHFFHCIHNRSYEDWLAYCMIHIPLCDALLVLPGESSGVEREVEIAKALGIPVFYDIESLNKWLA
jgi:hypothetical protein